MNALSVDEWQQYLQDMNVVDINTKPQKDSIRYFFIILCDGMSMFEQKGLDLSLHIWSRDEDFEGIPDG